MGKITSQPKKCTGFWVTLRIVLSVCLNLNIHFLNGLENELGLGLGFVWLTKVLCTLKQWDLKHGPNLQLKTQAYRKNLEIF